MSDWPKLIRGNPIQPPSQLITTALSIPHPKRMKGDLCILVVPLRKKPIAAGLRPIPHAEENVAEKLHHRL
jgi:hypothetical protein